MKTIHMAVVVPIEPDQENDGITREAVWCKTTRLLMPQLGKTFTRFEPSAAAWRQKVGQPFGVVLGKSEPALFLYFYTAAKAYQEAAIKFHLAGFLDGLEPTMKNEQGDATVYAIEVKGDGKEIAPHMLWHVAMINGELLPDCGIYHLREKRAFVDETQDRQILSHLDRYALCVVTLAMEDAA